MREAAWGSAVVWGSDVAWSSAVVWGSNLVWTDPQSWGNAVVWGSDAIGTVEGDAVVWGATGGMTAQTTGWRSLEGTQASGMVSASSIR
jgi:hypothetical protein